MHRTMVLVFLLVLFLSKNSEAGLFDFRPEEKLAEADYMMKIKRPLAADSLINEVIKFCGKKNDEPCLATAYFNYGILLMWWSVPDDYDRQKNANQKISSYVDKDVFVKNLDQKSMEYFEKALELAKKNEMDANVSGIYIKIGILQFTRFKDQASACESFDQSLRYNLRFQKNNPDQKVVLPKGFKSFEEYVLQGKKEMGCLK